MCGTTNRTLKSKTRKGTSVKFYEIMAFSFNAWISKSGTEQGRQKAD
jgi:hypothetical protein